LNPRPSGLHVITGGAYKDLVPHDRLLTKIESSGVDSRVVIWIREFFLGSTQRITVGGKLTEEVRVTSGVGRAIAQAVSRWLPTVAARVLAQVRSCEICGGQRGAG
jgi:hypothetical protein